MGNECRNSVGLDGIIVYDPAVENEGVRHFGSYTFVEEKRNPLGYALGELVEKVERSIVQRKDDPFYTVSSTIANRMVNDRTVGSMIALGIYSLLKEVGGAKRGARK